MRTGVSLYLSTGADDNAMIVEKAVRAGATLAFTSLQIPEEAGIDHVREACQLLGLCHEAGLPLMADVSPKTLSLLGCSTMRDLIDLGIDHIRLDYGFTPAQVVELSQDFHVVFNASTITRNVVRSWRSAGADLSRFDACHNFYPKPLTGLALSAVARTNRWLADLGLGTMAFVPGDGTLRGPLHEGLPTVEAHRGATGDAIALAALELADADTDVVLVGDPDLAGATWDRMAQLSADELVLRARVDAGWEDVVSGLHHDRPDSSEYVIRSQESRGYAAVGGHAYEAIASSPRPLGSISVGNVGYARYAGELEIARRDLSCEPRVNVIGQVIDEDLPFLEHVRAGRGFRILPV